MTRSLLLKLINRQLKKNHQTLMNRHQLDVIVLDTSRVLDTQIVKVIDQIKQDQHYNFNSIQRKNLRLKLLGYPIKSKGSINKYRSKVRSYVSKDILQRAYSLIINGVHQHQDAVIDTIISRYKLYDLHQSNHINQKYIDYLRKLQAGKYQLIYINVNANQRLDSNDLNHFIKGHYSQLSNYHNCVITFTDTKDHKINWNTLAKVAIFMENFRLEKHFRLFQVRNRSNRIKELSQFLKQNPNIKDSVQLVKAIKSFYSGISCGFQFVDLFISKDGSRKSLVMQKVQLDNQSKRCPACFQKDVHSNSCPQLLLRSFECENPKCPARSKSGRGKRFDLISAKRQVMLKRNDPQDYIDSHLYEQMHRDITTKRILNPKTMIQFYTWSDDQILLVNQSIQHQTYQGRSIYNTKLNHQHHNDLFNHLRIVQLLRFIYKQIQLHENPSKIKQRINQQTLIINDNSMNLKYYQQNEHLSIGSAITSPPYYNARKYSHWTNFLCYLVDMMIDAKVVYDALNNHGIYIYNVGDIVDLDYVYIRSHMSKCRLMLGFYSALIFKIVGFNLKNDIIWDKGEVQSKRNASPNHFAGYLKPVNSYEHNLVFCKGSYQNDPKLLQNKVLLIPPVKKINSKGKNTYGHSAPFPRAIAKLILPFAKRNQYILDPFLGSGTTCIVANDHNYKSVGFELSPHYYQLAINKIKHQQMSLF